LGTLTRSGSLLFDNRKAGKSTPITWQGLRFLLGQWCGLFTSFARESSNTVEEKAAYSKPEVRGWKWEVKDPRPTADSRFPRTTESKASNRYLK